MITEKILERVNNLPENTNERIHELEQSSSENEITISSLKNKVDKLYGDNKNLNNTHIIKSYPGQYFGTIEKEKDLNNIKYNLICYTRTNDELINLPNGETGGSGILEVVQVFSNSSAVHTIQRYTNTVTNISYIRSFNKTKETWTTWDKINGGQNHKLTEDNGTAILLPTAYDLNNLKNTGIYNGNELINAPSSDWWYIEVMQHTNLNGFVYQRATSLSNNVNINKFERQMVGDTWGNWKQINGGQNHKLTEDNGVCKDITGEDANNISVCGYYKGQNIVNAPSNEWYYIETMVHNNSYQVQTAIKLHDPTTHFTRIRNTNGWQPWREL